MIHLKRLARCGVGEEHSSVTALTMILTIRAKKVPRGQVSEDSILSVLASGQGDDGSFISVLILFCDFKLGVGRAFGKGSTLWKLWCGSLFTSCLIVRRVLIRNF